MSADVITDLPRLIEVPGHHQPAPFYLTEDMFGGIPLHVAAVELSDRVGKPVAAPHRHAVDEIYLLLAPTEGGATIAVTIDGTTHRVDAPAAVRVPAGAEHYFVAERAERGSFCLGLLLPASEQD